MEKIVSIPSGRVTRLIKLIYDEREEDISIYCFHSDIKSYRVYLGLIACACIPTLLSAYIVGHEFENKNRLRDCPACRTSFYIKDLEMIEGLSLLGGMQSVVDYFFNKGSSLATPEAFKDGEDLFIISAI